MIFLSIQGYLHSGSCPQAAQPLGDKQAQVAALHERTRDIMDKLRETLRDEHSFSFQACLRTCSGLHLFCTVRQLQQSRRLSALLMPVNHGHVHKAVVLRSHSR